MTYFVFGLIIAMWLVVVFAMVGHEFSNNDIFCKLLRWHKDPLIVDVVNDIDVVGVCPRCNKPLKQDMHGDWEES